MNPNLRILPLKCPFMGRREAPELLPWLKALNYDVLVIPGDLGVSVESAIPLLVTLGRPVVLTLGNSDMRTPDLRRPGYTLSERFEAAQALAKGTDVHVLNRRSIVLLGHRFVGAHLGFGLHGHMPQLVSAFASLYNDLGWGNYDDLFADDKLHAAAERLITTHGAIGTAAASVKRAARDPFFASALIVASFKRDLSWLRGELSGSCPYPTVILTHTSPDTFEYENAHSRDVWALIQESPVRNRDLAEFALSTNQTDTTLGGLDLSTCAAWVYAQGSSGATRLAQSGAPLVHCGQHPSGTSDDVNSGIIQTGHLHHTLRAAAVAELQGALRREIGELQPVADTLAYLKSLEQPPQPVIRPLLSHLCTMLEHSIESLSTWGASHSYLRHTKKWDRCTQALSPWKEQPRTWANAQKMLNSLQKLSAASPEGLCTNSGQGLREFRFASKVIAEVLAGRGLSGTVKPENPVAQLYSRAARHLQVMVELPTSESPVEEATQSGDKFVFELENELARALATAFLSPAAGHAGCVRGFGPFKLRVTLAD